MFVQETGPFENGYPSLPIADGHGAHEKGVVFGTQAGRVLEDLHRIHNRRRIVVVKEQRPRGGSRGNVVAVFREGSADSVSTHCVSLVPLRISSGFSKDFPAVQPIGFRGIEERDVIRRRLCDEALLGGMLPHARAVEPLHVDLIGESRALRHDENAQGGQNGSPRR